MSDLFISHTTSDREIVDILAELIIRVSLRQISVWYSSDNSINGGYAPGDDWRERIILSIKQSRVVISLLTPNSIMQPWVLYEYGYADAINDCEVVPVRFLLNLSEIPSPMTNKQIFCIDSVEDTEIFLDKLLNYYGIKYDKLAYRGFVNKAIGDMKNEFRLWEAGQETNEISILSRKVDTYFEICYDNLIKQESSKYSYEIAIIYNNSKMKEIKEYISINNNTTVSDVLDNVFSMISDLVAPYKYLESWIIKEEGEARVVAISDFQSDIPAMYVFRPETMWRVFLLDEPYKPNNKYNKANNIPRIFPNHLKE